MKLEAFIWVFEGGNEEKWPLYFFRFGGFLACSREGKRERRDLEGILVRFTSVLEFCARKTMWGGGGEGGGGREGGGVFI